MKTPKVKHRIEIWAEWGSEFSEQTGMQAIDELLRAWVGFYTSMNKGNKVTVQYSKYPIPSKPSQKTVTRRKPQKA